MAAHTASAQVNAAEYVDASMNELSHGKRFDSAAIRSLRAILLVGNGPLQPLLTQVSAARSLAGTWQWTTVATSM